MSKMTLKTEGDTHVIVTRRFAAPPEAVYRAHNDPKLIQKWLLGPEGWTMPVCINEARVGGTFRYEWTNGKGGEWKRATSGWKECFSPNQPRSNVTSRIYGGPA